MALDRRFYNAATKEKSTSADENFLLGGILNKGNSFLTRVSRMGAVRNDS
jgi:hypothetical protein